MAKEKILIIEDEANLVEVLKFNLEKENYGVLTASKGVEGLNMARKEKVDLILLDLMLPEMDGLEICKVLKQNEKTNHIPIIMLTAKAEETDKIVGLELGADDYITKPFSPRELMARIKALLRRVRSQLTPKVIKAGQLEVDTERHKVLLRGERLELTSKEYGLLTALMEAKGRLLSREYLLEKVWGYDNSLNIETRTVDMHVGLLRKKIKKEAERIVTIKNAGYRFEYE